MQAVSPFPAYQEKVPGVEGQFYCRDTIKDDIKKIVLKTNCEIPPAFKARLTSVTFHGDPNLKEVSSFEFSHDLNHKFYIPENLSKIPNGQIKHLAIHINKISEELQNAVNSKVASDNAGFDEELGELDLDECQKVLDRKNKPEQIDPPKKAKKTPTFLSVPGFLSKSGKKISSSEPEVSIYDHMDRQQIQEEIKSRRYSISSSQKEIKSHSEQVKNSIDIAKYYLSTIQAIIDYPEDKCQACNRLNKE